MEIETRNKDYSHEKDKKKKERKKAVIIGINLEVKGIFVLNGFSSSC